MSAISRRAFGGLMAGGALALGGCASSRARTLRVSFSPLSYRTIYERLGRLFEATHPGWSVEYDGARSYEDLAQKTMREAMVEDLPDVSHQGISNVRMLHERSLALPLDPFLAGGSGLQALGYDRRLADLNRYGNVTAGLPFALSVPVIYFNVDIVRRSGWDPTRLPTDWNGLLALADSIRRHCGRDVISLYLDYGANNALYFQTLLTSLGGRMADPSETRPGFDSAAGRGAMELLARMHRVGQIDVSREQAVQAFAAGALGILFATSSMLQSLRAQAGDRFKVAMRPFPITAPSGTIPAGGNALVIIAPKPERQQIAWDYIRFVLAPERQALMAQTTGYGPVNRIAAERKDLLGSLYARDREAGAATRVIPRLGPWYAFPGPNAIRITDGITDHMQQVVTGRRPPDVALKAMVAETAALMRSNV